MLVRTRNLEEKMMKQARHSAVPAHGHRVSGADLTVLDRCIGNNPEIRSRLLKIFARSLHEIQPALEHAVNERHCAPLAKMGHALKNSARTIGAGALGDVSESLEAAARSGCWFRIERLVPVFRTEADRVLFQIDRTLQ
jgi:HPt (histidine-containing phosphotransfer) domain-containing protein